MRHRLAAAAPSLLLQGLMSASVLVIADRPDFATLIGRCLGGIGVRALVALDVRHAAHVLQREKPDAVVLDLVLPADYDATVQWLRRDPARAGMTIVRVSAVARNGGVPRGEVRADVVVPKPFAPRQMADAVRGALARKAARQRFAPHAATARPAPAGAAIAAR
jgi:DNA-binding response OmpR family regulator